MPDLDDIPLEDHELQVSASVPVPAVDLPTITLRGISSLSTYKTCITKGCTLQKLKEDFCPKCKKPSPERTNACVATLLSSYGQDENMITIFTKELKKLFDFY